MAPPSLALGGKSMELDFRQLNPHACKTYLVGAKGTGEIALVDPVLEHVNDYLDLMKREELRLTHVIDTHTHADHISGAAALRDHTACNYVMHQNSPVGCVSTRVSDGSVLFPASIRIDVMYTPGHTRDSICLVLLDRILTGDTLFLDDGGAGRDDLPGGDAAAHWESLQRLLVLPDNLIVYPAHEYHGREPSSLAMQRTRNPHLKPRSKEEFVKYVEDLKLGPAAWMKDVLKANYSCALDPGAAWIPADLPACELQGTLTPGVNEQPVASVEPQELKRRLEAHESMLLLDVREAGELSGELGRLDKIVNMPIGTLSMRLEELEPYRSQEIITICRSGGRAHTAAQILAQAGFRQVHVLAGGMTAWNKLGYHATGAKQLHS
jgi:glyoxylase-like metal-dependent hydrolase (beta-lactamase superfamily II)/rhodanese-related sulfurtransferase